MLNICETCPNNKANFFSDELDPGEAVVYVDQAGCYDWIAFEVNADEDGNAVSIKRGTVNDPDGETFPALTSSINACKGLKIERTEMLRPGVRGRLLGQSIMVVTAVECPAFAERLDVSSAGQVAAYFGIPPQTT